MAVQARWWNDHVELHVKLTHLLDDVIEVAARKHLPNLEPPVWGHIGGVSHFSCATTAGEHADDATAPLEDDGTRISGGREGTPLPVTRQDGYLDGCRLDVVISVDASERVQPIDATYGGARGQAILHHVEPLASSCWGKRISLSFTIPLAWRRPPHGYL